jgi:hypothetical protein
MCKKYIKVFLTIFILCGLILSGLPLKACTLWGATGNKTKDGITLVAKNRDWKADNNTKIEIVTPEEGYKYLSLTSDSEGSGGIKGGINNEGLVIVSATAVTVDETDLGKEGLNKQALAYYNTVDSILNDKNLLSNINPGYFLLGDKKKIAVIEVAPDGQYSVDETDNGYLCHTNHYFHEEFLDYNETGYEGSETRLNRIEELLAVPGKLLTMKDFITFSEDQNDGPDNSIWRTGSEPERARTLASWIVAIPKNSCPELYIKFANPDEEEQTSTLKLDNAFWAKESI